MENGQQYKLLIRQWWGATDAESVTQRSASVFLTRTAPVLTVAAIPSPLTVRKYAFTAAYSQAQGDTLNWVRWMLQAGNSEEVLYDSGRIYGTAELRMEYDGLFSNTDYAVRCQVQTENGVQADTGWVSFRVAYDTTEVSGAVVACPNCKQSGIRVTWPGLYDVQGTAAGENRIQIGKLVLGADGTVIWDKVTGQPMNYAQPWSLVWSGTVDVSRDNPIVTVGMGETSAVLSLGKSGGKLTVGGSTVWSQALPWLRETDRFTVAIANGNVYLRQITLVGGIYPLTTLFPSVTLFPIQEHEELRIFTGGADLTGKPITSLTLGGVQTCDYLWVTGETLDESILSQILSLEGWTPGAFSGNTLFQTDFAGGGLQAGNLTFAGTLTGFAIYRYHEGDATLEPVAQTPLSERAIWDCKAVSQETYRYYMFGLGKNTDGADVIVTNALISDAVTPIFWDWTVLQCTKDAEGAYHPEVIFRFSLNVASGGISNNNSPGVLGNFTRYPTVQSSPSDYRSGTLSAAIGRVLASGEYTDTNEVRDAVYALSTPQDALFLKDRRGDLWQIRAGGAISMSTMDGSRQQVQTVTLPWVEIGSADGARILLTSSDALFA